MMSSDNTGDSSANKQGVVYVGHMPKGFEENELRKYFKQFGDVKRLKVSRSVKTGASKGYAFVQFKDNDVAKIAADTMNNYIMFKKSLKAHIIEPEKVNPAMFRGCTKKFVPSKGRQKAVAAFNRCDEAPSAEVRHKRSRKNNARQRKLAALGYEVPGTKSLGGTVTLPQSAHSSPKIADSKPLAPKMAVNNSTKKAEATPTSVQKVPKKSVKLSSVAPAIIRNDVENLSEDDEISFKSPGNVLPTKQKNVPSNKVYPKTPLPQKDSSLDGSIEHSSSTVRSMGSVEAAEPSSAKKAKVIQSEASPVLQTKSGKKRFSTPATQQPMRTPPKAKSPKISPRVTRSAHKKRKSMI